MKNTSKKGFTIVELVIVIAVIAILAAVLIPTFASIVRKANISKDTQLVRNLNVALAAETAKPATMHEVLAIAKEYGYDVEKINASADQMDIVWDSVNNLFCYYDEEADKLTYIPEYKPEQDTADHQLWAIYTAVPEVEDQVFSIYYAGAAIETATVKVGFDAGDATVGTIAYTSPEGAAGRDLVFRTGGGNLTVDGALDNVNHYGAVEVLDVKAVAKASYHEYGSVTFASLLDGHISFESGSSVEALFVERHGNGSYGEAIVSFADSVEMPKFYRDVPAAEWLNNNYNNVVVLTVSLGGKATSIALNANGLLDEMTFKVDGSEVELNDLSDTVKGIAEQLANKEAGEDAGVEKDTAMSEVMAYLNVKAYVSDVDVSGLDSFGMIANTEYASSAYLDKAFIFNAFEEKDKELVYKFLEVYENNNGDLESSIEYIRTETAFGDSGAERIIEIWSQRENYFSWICDFEVSFDKDIKLGSVALAGQYGNAYGDTWSGFGMADVQDDNGSAKFTDLSANTSVRLLQSMALAYPNIKDNFIMNYMMICGYVREFGCGYANLDPANVGATITVQLCIYKTDANGNEIVGDGAERIVCGTYSYTLGAVADANK